jgi:hypothetical protein
MNMFDFRTFPDLRPLTLDPKTGAVLGNQH